MSLLREARKLARRCEVARQRCRAEQVELERKMDEIRRNIAGHEKQLGNLRLMSRDLIQPCTTDRAGLYEVMRRIAVCRGKMQLLELERQQWISNLHDVEKIHESKREMSLRWQHKEEKFLRCIQKERRQLNLSRLLREESEIQERIVWKV